jgi:hypothetical protein
MNAVSKGAVMGAIAVLAFIVPSLSAPALADSGPTLVVDYTNAGLTPSHWVLTLSPDGTGHFRSERGNAPMDPSLGFEAPNVDRDVKVSPQFASQVFQTIHLHRNLNIDCDSHMKVAFQGMKRLTYTGPDGSGSCEFNYAKLKDVQSMSESLVAVAGGILEGARLEVLLQHDRLGLDKEMNYLVEAVGDGRVQQIGAIREILERLANDEGVMERVRKRARTLLEQANG